MIKNSIDFDYAINKITEEKNADIKEQKNILDSTSFNHTFKEVEETLNTLYEKTRYLEDSIQYAKSFLDTKIRDFNNEMQSTIKELESLLDMSKNLSYISYNVPLKANSIYINDRDSHYNNLSPLIIKDSALTLGYKKINKHKLSSINRICDCIPYDDNLNTAIKTEKYQGIYLEEKLIKDGLRETLVFYFPKPITINVLDFKPINCSVQNIRFGLINGIEERAHDYNLAMTNTYRTCIYIKIDLVCTNYNTIIYEVEKDKITNSLWSDLKQHEVKQSSALLNKDNKLKKEYIISRTTVDRITGQSIKENYSSPDKKDTVFFKLYSYIFGLDSFSFINSVQESSGYFISDYINIGSLTKDEYISLNVSQVKNDNACIEYSILDGEKEIPIIPQDIETIENEPIFNNLETRFVRDINSLNKEIIKKDGQLIDISYDDAKTMTDGKYSITYTPSSITNVVTPINKEIRIKAYIRMYGSDIKEIPYIDLITIRKYGEETLWINKY